MPTQEPIAELLAALDDFIIARATGGEDKKSLERVIKARRNVGEVTASKVQLIAVLERQVDACFQPIINERRLCDLLGCHSTWLLRERQAGRWLNFEVDGRGRRFYTPEQILANLRGENRKRNLKQPELCPILNSLNT